MNGYATPTGSPHKIPRPTDPPGAPNGKAPGGVQSQSYPWPEGN